MVGFLLAWSISTLAPQMQPPEWHNDYSAAHRRAQEQQRPLFVVLAHGKEGWNQLTAGQPWSAELRRKLAERFVCVYLDRNEPHGKAQASAFGNSGEPMLIISTRDLRTVAVKRYGFIASADLDRLLDQHSGRGGPVVEHRSFYGPSGSQPQPYAPAPIWNPGFGGPACPT